MRSYRLEMMKLILTVILMMKMKSPRMSTLMKQKTQRKKLMRTTRRTRALNMMMRGTMRTRRVLCRSYRLEMMTLILMMKVKRFRMQTMMKPNTKRKMGAMVPLMRTTRVQAVIRPMREKMRAPRRKRATMES